jgi:hypothetical protein
MGTAFVDFPPFKFKGIVCSQAIVLFVANQQHLVVLNAFESQNIAQWIVAVYHIVTPFSNPQIKCVTCPVISIKVLGLIGTFGSCLLCRAYTANTEEHCE